MSIFNQLESGLTTGSAEETRKRGAEIAQALPNNVVVTLQGELGAGKTTLVQGMAEGLGVTDDVTSPSFAILQIYEGTRLFAHVDGYRLEDPAQAEGLLLEDFLREPWLLVVEWPERLAGWLPRVDLAIQCRLLTDGRHEFRQIATKL